MSRRRQSRVARLRDGQLAVIDALYGAVGHPGRWQEVIAALTRLLGDGYGYGAIMHRDKRTETHLVLAGNLPPNYVETYEAHYAFVNPLSLATNRRRPLLQANDDVVAAGDFESSEFYFDWMRHLGARHPMNTYVPIGHDGTIEFSFCRPQRQGPFDQTECDMMLWLIPHIRRAVELSRRLEIAEASRTVLTLTSRSFGSGLMVVDSDRRVLFMDTEAERLIRNGNGLSIRNGRLRAGHGTDDRLGHAIMTATGRGRSTVGRTSEVLTAPRGEGLAPLSIAVTPMDERDRPAGLIGPLAFVAVSMPERAEQLPEEGLRVLFDLTPAEARLVTALCSGETLAGYAGATGATLNTVKTHLKHVFEKTGETRQTDLVRRVATDLALRIASRASL
jgi:DNA-binding CsgD family transcriptional regulator